VHPESQAVTLINTNLFGSLRRRDIFVLKMSLKQSYKAPMSFNVDDLPSPENRCAAQWVTFYLRLENSVSQGETITVDGRSVSMPDLQTIRASRVEWENRIGKDAQKTAGRRSGPVYLG
jgi:hypothetical protein